MDVAYDHIQEEALSPESETATATAAGEQEGTPRPRAQSNDLGTEFKEAYQAVASTAWGARLGGFFGQVKKQSETYLDGVKQELGEVSVEANKGWAGLVSRAQAASSTLQSQVAAATAQAPGTEGGDAEKGSSEKQQKDFLKETGKLVSVFKKEGAARLKQIQAVEDAADDALERFGANLGTWFKDAVSIAPPGENKTGAATEVLFESKDAEGKRVVHATRFDAQLHVIHSRLSSFTADPDSEEYKPWKETFDAEQKTDAIKRDLEKYEELRRAMEKLVPEQVSYADFWCRYYFLRHVIESEEQKRRELLKGAQIEDDEVAWDDDEEEEEDKDATPDARSLAPPQVETQPAEAGAEAPTLKAVATMEKDNDLLKPNEGRRSNEHSVADSDASYDLVSGAPSRGQGTPTEEKPKTTVEQSDDEDWE